MSFAIESAVNTLNPVKGYPPEQGYNARSENLHV